jgi:RNA-directed DNA polymerase
LGMTFTSHREPKRRIAPKALVRFKERIRELTRRTRGISLPQMVEQLFRYLNGWRAYFGFCQTPSVLADLDSWIRRRLRSVLWKQWKRGKRRFAELRARNVGKDFGGPNRREPPRPLAARPQPRAELCTAERLLSVARPTAFGCPTDCLTSRTAVYGPVRTVV